MGRVEGKTAIVTGGAQGLGKAIAGRLAKEGAFVNIFDIGDGAEAVAEIRQAGGQAEAYSVNITDRRQVEQAVAEILERRKTLDILVNNAGVVSAHENLLSVTDEIWEREIGINLTGTFYCCRAVLGAMIQQKSGKIVNISSIAGDTGRPQTSPAYSAAKAGVYGLTMSMARSVAKHGINVNAVCPGVILTGIHASYPKEELDALLAQIPYSRGGKPDDIAGAVLFLAGPDSDYITGARIRVNGGSWMG
ncbi:SDR family NAD(P)-dependent oxidoreductase [Bacilliculturomica massiliensis]|uniref:SDR family NAD(P)-dependent oxidoreductase n=1 Tax=Bacilliculturomica massiliensis TaxID=1917867 RepID=UPI001031F394|nr:3-oxoacyl-ACP reductase FabG [Bacilliculturomica massiliensis]